MIFAAGFLGASWLWVLALVVARFYGTWRRYDGWTELRIDLRTLTTLASSGSPSSTVESIGIGTLLGWSAAWATFLYALSR